MKGRAAVLPRCPAASSQRGRLSCPVSNTITPKLIVPSLDAARWCFRGCYHRAAPEDVTRADTLVAARDKLAQMINIPGGGAPLRERLSLERACNTAELAFMKAWNAIHNCTTFRRLHEHDWKKIEAALSRFLAGVMR